MAKLDPLVVRTADLAPFIRKFIDQFESDHPRNDGKPIRHGLNGKYSNVVRGYGGVSYIAFYLRHGKPTDRVQRSPEYRRLERVLHQETKYVELGFADEILTIIGRADLLQTDIPIIPNPRISAETFLLWRQENGGWCED